MNDEQYRDVRELVLGHEVLLCAMGSVLVESIASWMPEPKAATQQIVGALYDAIDGFSMPEGSDALEIERAQEGARRTIDLLFSGARDESGHR